MDTEPVFQRVARRSESLIYDHNTRSLKVGDKCLVLDRPDMATEQNLFELSPEYIGWEETEQAIARAKKLDGSMVLLSATIEPITTPEFNDWLFYDDRSKEMAETTEVIAEVFDKLYGNLPEFVKEARGGFMSFSALRIDSGLGLTTFGNCACLGPNPSGYYFRHEELAEGWREYAWHNNDTATQTLSLLAGMGHIALLASKQN